jgi:hypothetical protein
VLLAEASAGGVRLRLAGDGGVKVAGGASPELLARLREHKAELVELLSGDHCRHCGGQLDHALTGALPFVVGDGRHEFAHVACYETAEVARLRARAGNATSPPALADEGEVTMRGELG